MTALFWFWACVAEKEPSDNPQAFFQGSQHSIADPSNGAVVESRSAGNPQWR